MPAAATPAGRGTPAGPHRCAACGLPLAGGPHERCRLDPPRFCTRCGRRLRVQVFPLEYRAACPACDRHRPLPGPAGKLSGELELGGAAQTGATEHRAGHDRDADTEGLPG